MEQSGVQLAEKYGGLSAEFVAEWNTCTFVYVLRRDTASKTVNLGYVSSDLSVCLSEPHALPTRHYDLLMRMHRPALVFSPDCLSSGDS